MLFIIMALLLIVILVGIAYLFPTATVIGDSMYPTLRDGQKLNCTRIPVLLKRFTLGGIYVYQCPYDDKLVIKRLSHKKGDRLFFLGDNLSNSIDSRAYGYVDAESIVAKMVAKKKQT